jgi:hypothetical protein
LLKDKHSGDCIIEVGSKRINLIIECFTGEELLEELVTFASAIEGLNDVVL